MAEYIEREAALAFQNEVEPVIAFNGEQTFTTTRDSDMVSYLNSIPAADVVSRKAYLEAIGTINEAHFYPERAEKIINAFLESYHSMCMEWSVENG